MKDELPTNISAWLDEAIADATRRGIPQLAPLLRSLARSTTALRAAEWNQSVRARESGQSTAASNPGMPAGAPREEGSR